MSIRSEFPMLTQNTAEKPLAFLDSTATTQKPAVVIEAMDRFYRTHYSSVKRGNYRLSAQTTRLYEDTRQRLAEFFGISSPDEIVFTRGTTESINLVAWSWGLANLRKDDEILISALEHHANIVPWQIVAGHTGSRIRVIPCDDQADLLLEQIPDLLTPKTRLVAITHIANSTGTVNPLSEIIPIVRRHSDALILVDGAQSAAHLPVNLQQLDADFFVCSAHKMYGPTGVGMLYAKRAILEKMPPWQGGGEMIDRVSFSGTTFADIPARFEAGTPPVAEVIGFGAAIRWIGEKGIAHLHAVEEQLLQQALNALQQIPEVRILGNPRRRASIISFNVAGIHAHDVAMILDEENIAVRSGHHCAQPVMERFGVPATVRASFAAYNEPWEIDRLVQGIQRAVRLFS